MMSKVRDTFTGIADVYDRMNHVLSLGLDIHWRRTAIRMAEASPSSVLDVACGTGDMSLELARSFPCAEITGVDFTPAMLDVARGKCSGEARIRLLEGDAMALPFGRGAEGRSFDLVTCAWGFRKFPDKRKALSECARVLAPGGRLVVLEFFRPEHMFLGWLTALWLRILSPLFAPGRRGAYAYLRESMRSTVAEGEFAAMAGACSLAARRRRFLFPACTCLVFEKRA